MGSELAFLHDGQLSLFELAEQANEEHGLCRQAGEAMLNHAVRCGELLHTAKQQVAHGEWLPWLEANFAGSEWTAQAYMRLSANPGRVTDFDSIRGALRELRDDNTRGTMGASESVEWATPQEFFDLVDAEFGFTLDVCAVPEFAKCERHYSPDDDGLNQTWEGVCWMNPPYGQQIGLWMQKAYETGHAGHTVVCLVPARVDTAWWWDYAIQGEIRFLKGRLTFAGATSPAPFPSALVIFPSQPKVVWWNR